MSDPKLNLDSLFEAAVEISSAAERAAFIEKSCGENSELRQQLERLLESNEQAGSFLEKPPVEMEATILSDSSSGDLAASLDAGLASVFTADQAVVLGDENHSILKILGQTQDRVPRVALRDSVEAGADPVVRPKSPEMPQRDSDSRYRLDGEIARGGMGAILKGRDTYLGRDLAIKVLLDQHKDKPEVVARFVEEAQIAGQLQHPGVAPIYELGQFADKRPFFAMKLVKGKTLSKLLGDRKDPAEERARFIGIFGQICQTMAYAHSRGVIHRDLKPANIMVGAFGEVQVMDWGLAKVLASGGVADERKAFDKQQGQSVIQTMRSGAGSDVKGTLGTIGSQTQMGSVMGTPAYMPPEQALGEIDNLDERADVFGLGAILCEILTGKPPYVADNGTRVFRMASRGKLEDCFQRLEACSADEDLVELTKLCLKLEPADRPRNAGILAELITKHIESVEARLRETEVERAAEAARAEEALHTVVETEARTRAERRAKRLQLTMAAIVALVATIGGLAAAWTAAEQIRLKNDAVVAERRAVSAREKEAGQRILAEEAKTRAEEEKLRAETEKTRAEIAQQQADVEKIRSLNMLADMQTERGLQTGRAGQSATAALWFASAAALTPHDLDRQQANHLRASSWMDQAIMPVALLKLPDGMAQRFAFQPHGSLLLTISGNKLRVWDWRNEEVLPWSETLVDVTDAVWSPDGTQLAVSLGASDVRICDPISGDERKRFQHSERVSVMEWSPDATRLAVGGMQVQIWNVMDDPLLESTWPHPHNIFAMRFNRSGTRLLTSCDDNQARLFAVGDASLPAPLFAPVDHAPLVKAVWGAADFFDADQRLVTVSAEKKQPMLRDAATGLLVSPDGALGDSGDRAFAVSPDGRWVAAAEPTVLLNAEGQRIELKHFNHVQTLNFTPDGAALVTTCFDGIARWWPLHDLASPSPSFDEPITFPQMATFAQCQVSPDGSSFAISTSEQLVIWERQPSPWLVGQISWPESFWKPRVSFDGLLVTPGTWHEYPAKAIPRGNTLLVARTMDGEPAGPTIKLDGALWDSCVCADNRTVVAATAQGSTGILTFYDIESGAKSLPLLTLPDVPHSVAARPGHPEVAVLCRNGQMLIVNTETGKPEREYSHPEWPEYSQASRVAYSPDGATLVSVTPNHRVHVWNAKTGDLRFPPLQPVPETCYIRSIAFSPDSRLLATAVNGRNMVEVWDLVTGKPSGTPLPHPGDFYGLWSVAFSPDGQRIVTGHKDGRARLWDWKSGELVGAPMQHPEEVLDAQFTPDGRQILTAVRLNTMHVWDTATNKLAIPLPTNLALPGQSTNTIAISRDRIVIGAETRNLLLDLSQLIHKPTAELATLLTRAELATNQKLQYGELMPLESHEWSGRWDQLVAKRENRDQLAEDLARALDEAADTATQRLVISRAARRGLLERLLSLRPNSLQLMLALALERAQQGRRADFERLRGEVFSQLREIVSKGPVDPSLMRTIGQLLIEDAPRGTWRPLVPIAMKGAEQTTFTREPNGFILAGVGNAAPETFSIEGRAAIKRIAALRLDVAPHSSLPWGGSGYSAGNFHLAEFRAKLRRSDGTETALKLNRAVADYVRPVDSLNTQADGPWGALDSDPITHWDIWPNPTQPHWLVLILDEPCDFDDNETLVVELDTGDNTWPFARLGHFRVSISGDERASLADELIAIVKHGYLPPDEMLAAACLINGEAQIPLRVLQEKPLLDSRDKLLRSLLMATAQKQLGQHAASRQTVAVALGESPVDSWSPFLTGFYLQWLRDIGELPPEDITKLCDSLVSRGIETELQRLEEAIEANPTEVANLEARAGCMMRLGRWREAADNWNSARMSMPDNRLYWFAEANCRLLAGEEADYEQLCQQMVDQFRGTTDSEIADSVIKTCLLRPSTIGQSEMPLQLLRDALLDPTRDAYHRWFVGSSALAFYREGKFDEAIACIERYPNNKQHSGALALVVRAMAEYQLGRHDQSRQSLAEAEALIPQSLRTLGTRDASTADPAPNHEITPDWLAPELLRREAAQLMK